MVFSAERKESHESHCGERRSSFRERSQEPHRTERGKALSLIGWRIPFFAHKASSGHDVAPQTQNLLKLEVKFFQCLAVQPNSGLWIFGKKQPVDNSRNF
jgi:hypothetical protein